MAFYRCGGGGDLTETTLWTNSSPTSSFAAQTVTLSDSMANYKYLKVTYRESTSSSTSVSVIMSVSDVQSTALTSAPHIPAVFRVGTTSYDRQAYYSSNTQIAFLAGYKVGASGSTTTYVIPTSIVGLK